MKNKKKPIKKRIIKNAEELGKIINKMNSYVYCIAKDKMGDIITPYLYTMNHSITNNYHLFQDVVSEVRIYKDREIGKYYNMSKIAGVYADVNAYPVYQDWIEFPITDVYLYTEETTDLLNHYKILGMWKNIE